MVIWYARVIPPQIEIIFFKYVQFFQYGVVRMTP